MVLVTHPDTQTDAESSNTLSSETYDSNVFSSEMNDKRLNKVELKEQQGQRNNHPFIL